MTTIATDGRSIASDSQMSGAYIDSESVKKIHRYKGHFIGIAGELSACLVFLDWYKNDCQHTLDIASDQFEAIVVTPEQEVYYYGGSHPDIPVKVGKQTSIGSGSLFAIAAMKAGASPKQAVQIACDLDPYSGGKIRTMTRKSNVSKSTTKR